MINLRPLIEKRTFLMASLDQPLITSSSSQALVALDKSLIAPQDRVSKIKKVAAEALISFAALSFIGIGVAWMITPITPAVMMTCGITILTTYALGFTLLPKQTFDITGIAAETAIVNPISSTDSTSEIQELVHIEALQKIWGQKFKTFLMMKDHARTLARSLGSESLSKDLAVSLEHAAALDKLVGQHWAYRILQQIEFFTKPEAVVQTYDPDPHKATRQELLDSIKGISNPCCNCFMISALQSLLQNQQLKTYILKRLQLINSTPGAGDVNPTIPDDYLVRTQCDKEDKELLLAKKGALLEELRQDASYKAKTARLPSYVTADLLKNDLSNRSILENIFMTLTLKEAATISFDLLSKWQSGSLLSSQESRLMRTCLIKLMNRPSELHLVGTKTSGTLEGKIRLHVPGLSGDFLIFEHSQEDVNLFSRNVLSSLDELTKTLAPAEEANPALTQIDCQFTAYTPPAEDQELEHFDESLKIPGAIKTVTQFISSWTPDLVDGQFVLDSLDCLSCYTDRRKENHTLKKDELLPSTEIGQVVDETAVYTISRPSVMVMNLNVFSCNAATGITSKMKNVSCKFTDEDNLTITIPPSDVSQKATLYKLSSLSIHSGKALNSGHYFSFSRKTRANGTSFWLKQDDSIVTEGNIHEIKHILKGGQDYTTPFMLVFDKIES